MRASSEWCVVPGGVGRGCNPWKPCEDRPQSLYTARCIPRYPPRHGGVVSRISPSGVHTTNLEHNRCLMLTKRSNCADSCTVQNIAIRHTVACSLPATASARTGIKTVALNIIVTFISSRHTAANGKETATVVHPLKTTTTTRRKFLCVLSSTAPCLLI